MDSIELAVSVVLVRPSKQGARLTSRNFPDFWERVISELLGYT
jgi:hypothetical protein